MKIKNKTKWDTNDIRKLCSRICRYEGYSPRTIEITSRGRGGGLGGIGYGWIQLSIPYRHYVQAENGSWSKIELQEISGKKIKTIAQTLSHEIGHNRGIRHKDMPGSHTLEIPDTSDIVVHRKPEKLKVKMDLKRIRHQKVLAKIKQKESQQKRITNMLKKLYRKKKYYEVIK